MSWRILAGAALLLPLLAQTENISNGSAGWGDPEVYLSAIAAVTGVLLLAGTLWALLRRHFARFRIRFVEPLDQKISAEDRGRGTVVALPTGESHIYFHLTPHIGIALESMNIAFFNNRTWPLRLNPFAKPNVRCKLTSIKATSLGVMDIKKNWTDYQGDTRNEEAMDFGFKPPLEFYAGKRKTFRASFGAAASMQNWDGILGIQLNYKHSGNGDSWDGITKVFVREKQSKRPVTFALRHLLWGYSGGFTPSTLDTPISQLGAGA